MNVIKLIKRYYYYRFVQSFLNQKSFNSYSKKQMQKVSERLDLLSLQDCRTLVSWDILYKLHKNNYTNCSAFFFKVMSVLNQELSQENLSCLDECNQSYIQLYLDFKNNREWRNKRYTNFQIWNFYLFLKRIKDIDYIIENFCNLDFVLQREASFVYENAKKQKKYYSALSILTNKKNFLNLSNKNILEEKIWLYQRMSKFFDLQQTEEQYCAKYKSHKYKIPILNYIINTRDIKKSIDYFSKLENLLSDKDKNVNYYSCAARIKMYQNDYNSALEYLNVGLSKKTSNVLMIYKAKLLTLLHRNQEALEIVNKLLEKDLSNGILQDLRLINTNDDQKEILNDISCYIDLRKVDDVDNFIGISYRLVEEVSKYYIINKVIFITKKEPRNVIPLSRFNSDILVNPLNGIFLSSLKDQKSKNILCVEADSLLNNDYKWIYVTNFEMASSEGILTSQWFNIYRKKVLLSFFTSYINNEIDYTQNLLDFRYIKTFLINRFKSNINLNISTNSAVFLSDRGLYLYGGVELFTTNIINIGHNINKKMYVVYNEKFKQTFFENVTYISYKTTDEIWEILLKINPDFIWCTNVYDMDYLRSKIILGNHFYRNFLIPNLNEDFRDDSQCIIRNSFYDVISKFDCVYVNSEFLRRMIFDKYEISLPIIYSLPYSFTYAENLDLEQRHYILTVGTSNYKGFYFVLKLAKKLPQYDFICIANQSDYDTAVNDCKSRDIENVLIVEFQSNMQEFYKKIKITLVPSFVAKETFSRVAVESQYCGIPVIGANFGNLPFILKTSDGICLDDDVDTWALHIIKLMEDGVYYQYMCQKALSNAKIHYDYEKGINTIKQTINSQKKKILVCIGSGLGNMIMSCVVLHKLCEYFKEKVDVFVSVEQKGNATIIGHNKYVNRVYETDKLLNKVRYDIVYITRSCHQKYNYYPYLAEKIYRVRESFTFADYDVYHESEVELKALKLFFNIDYCFKDMFDYGFKVTDSDQNTNRQKIVGLHAGCKSIDVWGLKAWPYYEELAIKLIDAGYCVVSLGSKHEVVKGTLDYSTKSSDDLYDNILKCDYVVSNDSGISWLALALNKPGTVIIGPTYLKKLLPHGNWTVLTSDVKCAPCLTGYRQSDEKYKNCNHECMKNITVEEVYSSVINDLQKL